MALPNTNISVSMVRDELGAATNDVGQLCTHPNINKWSKWKPIRFDQVTPIEQWQIEAVRSGLTYNMFQNVRNLCLSQIEDPTQAWVYNRPRGDTVTPAEPYRLEDFRNYNHEAIGLVKTEGIKPVIFHGDSQIVHFRTSSSSLQFYDVLYQGNDYQFGVYLVKQSEVNDLSKYKVKISPTPIINGMPDLSIGIGFDGIAMSATENMYLGGFFYSEGSPGTHYIPIEDSFTPFIYERGHVVDINFSMYPIPSSPNSYYWQINSIYNMFSANNFEITVEARYIENEMLSPLETGEQSFPYGSTYIAGYSTWSDTQKSFMNILTATYRGAYIGVNVRRLSDNATQQARIIIR